MRDPIETFVAVLVAVFLGMLLGLAVATTYAHSCAIEANVGRWTINEKTGIRAFEYAARPCGCPNGCSVKAETK